MAVTSSDAKSIIIFWQLFPNSEKLAKTAFLPVFTTNKEGFAFKFLMKKEIVKAIPNCVSLEVTRLDYQGYFRVNWETEKTFVVTSLAQ